MTDRGAERAELEAELRQIQNRISLWKNGVVGPEEAARIAVDDFEAGADRIYAEYERMLEAGVAREVARIVLPLNIYSSAYVTMNARAMMNFLSLLVSFAIFIFLLLLMGLP